MADPNRGFLWRAHRASVWFGTLYASVLLLLAIPFVQRHVLYLHKLKLTWGADYESPHLYGLAPHRAANVNITTSDGLRLGAWFVLADASYAVPPTPIDELAIRNAIAAHPTILFFHGNAATRAAVFRPRVYGMYTTRLQANVLVVDYRGFADSEGTPSEHGLIIDARAGFDWLTARGASAHDIVLMGQSLGTGVVAGLAAQLAEEGVDPRGVVLVAAFQSLPLMLEEYQMFGFLPLLRPLKAVPFITKLLFRFLHSRFDTEKALPSVRAPIILVHALNDADIPHTQSVALFNTLLEPHLSPIPPVLAPALGIGMTPEQVRKLQILGAKRAEERLQHVGEDNLVYANLKRFERRDGQGAVSLLLPVSGKHNEVLLSEGVIDFVGQTLSIKRGTC
ncbi:alpha/beta-hydrolase [Exidia glandulosa HHB12029]|uniref:Alpha/beta-hydrolase n=1 Tax=Exidia glandulosa HHB12029 TaxID=1314781 RepID=A0A166NAG6_EXIGL|nr:alpha/beta-hydrolase [Exidia glandulosa HHB12029]